MRTILLTGAAGLLGSALIKPLLQKHSVTAIQHQAPIPGYWPTLDVTSLDLEDKSALQELFDQRELDLVINCAGAVGVDRCEADHEYAISGNQIIVDNLIACLQDHEAHLLQISTDYVFPGDTGPNRERDEPTPINFYGISKLNAEKAIIESGISATILRVCALYSLEPDSKSNLLSAITTRLREGREVSAATDLWTTPTEINDLAQAICELVDLAALPSLLHLAAPEYPSRYEFALHVARSQGLNSELVRAVSARTLDLQAPRPAKAGLVSDLSGSLLAHQLSGYSQLISQS